MEEGRASLRGRRLGAPCADGDGRRAAAAGQRRTASPMSSTANINFTNVCIKRCGFCAFSRDFREEEGYFLPLNEIIRARPGGGGPRRDGGLHPGRAAAQDGRLALHRPDPRVEGGVAGRPHPRLLAGGGALRRGPLARLPSRTTCAACATQASARSPARQRRYSTSPCATASRPDASPSTSGRRSSPPRTGSASPQRPPSCSATSRRMSTAPPTSPTCATSRKRQAVSPSSSR